jgi:hypothetical protein
LEVEPVLCRLLSLVVAENAARECRCEEHEDENIHPPVLCEQSMCRLGAATKASNFVDKITNALPKANNL